MKPKRAMLKPRRVLPAASRHVRRPRGTPDRGGWGTGANEDSGLVFATGKGTPLDTQNIINRHFKPLPESAGLPSIRLDDLQHTCFTILLARGTHPKYVQDLAGHASINLHYPAPKQEHAAPDPTARGCTLFHLDRPVELANVGRAYGGKQIGDDSACFLGSPDHEGCEKCASISSKLTLHALCAVSVEWSYLLLRKL